MTHSVPLSTDAPSPPCPPLAACSQGYTGARQMPSGGPTPPPASLHLQAAGQCKCQPWALRSRLLSQRWPRLHRLLAGPSLSRDGRLSLSAHVPNAFPSLSAPALAPHWVRQTGAALPSHREPYLHPHLTLCLSSFSGSEAQSPPLCPGMRLRQSQRRADLWRLFGPMSALLG